MSDSTRELLETTKDVLLRCWMFGFVLLVISLGATLLTGNLIHDLHGSMFGLTNHELDLIFYCLMGILKLIVIACFFIPWLSIKLVLKQS
ncbi:MAG: hypothetical protein CMJ70_12525 [Planctomycetaceae bacterium]|nr:hypothetical protein [Planctomycetaceae bacterium]|tara:strand:- start:34 stop:303 length:270 start_codon:yes stop_codon:yes gene_type:complete